MSSRCMISFDHPGLRPGGGLSWRSRHAPPGREVELQIRDDVADVQKQATVFKEERHPGS